MAVERIDYQAGSVKAKGALVWNEKISGKRPLLLVMPNWLGVTDNAIERARKMAGDKYVAFHNALMATQGELPKERILDIAKSVGLDTAKLEKDMADPAVAESVKASNALADRLHFDGTPTFVINGQIIVGELTDAELQLLTKQPAPKG
mgnify:CR=1 FL=1